ncbi:LysR family transcriptional regulator [Acidaminobacter hydrogenoformans]|uniref:DNA-binding transcriptional regulator, LysR family n=1 Tax=Acidaminobacter hydrogenoformans DSM 2784 TaxID=1120920 RepID=A0A1G5RQH8_9FIRM|nr:LysR family transcriptional regulator [Acidaminobacter hydrogenoformans]SCZ76118.1 DNA-binding transcriptional regulator, LysR family [Acidaminobacter hydrogenoformans DSM 2784]
MKNLSIANFINVVEVAKCGSISRAAQNLYISQSNLSTSIKTLETELGYAIFTRSNQGVSVTPEGNLFIKSAKIIISEMENIEKLSMIGKSPKNNLSVVCVYSFFIFQKYIEFRKKFLLGDSKDSFKETGLNQAMQDIISKAYRIGFFYDFDSNIHKRWTLAEKYFLDINLLATNIPVNALLTKNHPLANAEVLTPGSLQGYPLVTFEDFENEDWLGAMGINADREVLYIFDRGGMIDTVRGGDYIGISVGKSFGYDEKSSPFATIPIEGIQHQLNQYWVKASSYELSEVEHDFLRFVNRTLNLDQAKK